MSVNSVEIPQISDPLVLAYLRICNTFAPTPELQKYYDNLRLQFAELRMACEACFAKCDETRTEQLLAEREGISEQAKSILSDIQELQASNGLRSSYQPTLANNQQTAQRKLESFVPRNRTIATLEQIEQSEAEKRELEKAVNQCKDAASRNHFDILGTAEQVKVLYRQYQELAAREEVIAAKIEELKLPPEQRGKPRSSIIWQSGESVFALQTP
jgi:chromosome segregation ATPase